MHQSWIWCAGRGTACGAGAKIFSFRDVGGCEEELILDRRIVAVASDLPLAVAVPVWILADIADFCLHLRWLERKHVPCRPDKADCHPAVWYA